MVDFWPAVGVHFIRHEEPRPPLPLQGTAVTAEGQPWSLTQQNNRKNREGVTMLACFLGSGEARPCILGIFFPSAIVPGKVFSPGMFH